MKVTLRRNHSWDSVKLVPEAASYDPEFEIDLPMKDVQDIIALQTQMEALQQRLLPLFKACEEKEKAAREAKAEEIKLAEQVRLANEVIDELIQEEKGATLTEPSGLASV